jgi:hypothetical protein
VRVAGQHPRVGKALEQRGHIRRPQALPPRAPCVARVRGELDRVEEYLVYRTNIMNSYNSLIVFFMLFHKYRFDNNSHYYLLRINKRISCFKNKQNPLTFNADFKVMANVLFNEYNFAEIYGIYNHYEVLQ